MNFRRIPYFSPDDNRSASGQSAGHGESEEEQPVKEAAPGIPIVRSNTPKPLSLGSVAPGGGQSHWTRYEERPSPTVFPVQAPSAPPLPEELGEQEGAAPIGETSTPLPVRPLLPAGEPQEFLWLFEYGLEMDPVLLNSPERLDGLALLYGTALLKGYRVVVRALKVPGSDYGEQAIVTILPAYEGGSEVWGVLYRVPRRVTERVGDELPLLDTVHAATPTQRLFKSIQVVVRETYREHDLNGVITYIASDRAMQQLLDASEASGTRVMIERLVAIGRKQKLPESYLRALSIPATAQDGVLVAGAKLVGVTTPPPRNTEPLSIQVDERRSENALAHQEQAERLLPARWLVAFATYLVCVLLVVLTLAVLEGSGVADGLLTSSFTPLHVPWLVLIYGLLGGCISCIATLGRCQTLAPPNFVVITWFARPYVGAVLALFAYLLLNCGIFTLSNDVEARNTLFMLIGALAGLCESWLFLRRRV